jgi:membrane protein
LAISKRREKFARVTLGIGKRWFDKDGAGKGAAVSFYTLFAAAPILFFSLLIAESFIGTEQAKTSAIAWLGGFISEADASSLVDLVHLRVWGGLSWWSTAIFTIVVLWSTSQMFMRLRMGVRDFFDERADSASLAIRRELTGRIVAMLWSISIGVLTAIGFVFVSLLPSLPALLELDSWWSNPLFRNTWPALLLTLCGALLIRRVPDNTPSWSSTLRASSFMLVAYTSGRLLLEIYMQHSTIVSAYGAASALVIFLIWMYFAAQVFFFAVALCKELDLVESKLS